MSKATFLDGAGHIVGKIVREAYSIGHSEGNTKIFASLVPDEIIYSHDKKETKQSYSGAVLFADVSGFTDLCEKYNSLGKGGPSRITQVLNAYIGAMVQEIMSHNGDILKFSGDAFLALWKCKDNASLLDVVHAAIDCALGIQRSHGTYKTEVGIVLRVKIAIAAGQVIFTIIGDSNFMILGSTIFDVKDVGNLCSPGEIIISPTVKMFLNPNEYILESNSNARSIIIKGIGPDWTPSQLSQQYEMFDTLTLSLSHQTISKENGSSSDLSLVVEEEDDHSAWFSYMLRPSIDYAASKNMKTYLRKFVIPPIVRVIELNEPLEYLTEMRQVVIVFINVVTVTLKIYELLDLCNSTYLIICSKVNEMEGCVNKVSMFDKDLMFLIIFGLRGFKHTLEAQRALYCAKNIRDILITLPNIQSASIGVTSGVTYCGVVGHPMRKEYTVIGRTVNKAARLMVAYPDKVTCDRQTFLHSQLQARYFTLQPPRFLKGFKDVGPIYEFDDETTEEEVIAREIYKTKKFPILGRRDELRTFYFHFYRVASTENLDLFGSSTTSIAIDPCKMLVIKGQARQGKTRLLNEFAYCVPPNVFVHRCSLNTKDKLKPYKAIRSIFYERLNLYNKNKTYRTNVIMKVLTPTLVPEFLCALNDILLVDFEVSKYYLRLDNDKKLYVQCKMIKYLSLKIFKRVALLTIDNIEYMDDKSWPLLEVILNCGVAFICVTLGIYSAICSEANQVFNNPDVLIMTLQPINEWFHAALICQFMDIHGVPLEIEKYIQIHSNGNPGWIESFLTTLIHSEGLKKITIDKSKANEAGIVMPPNDMISREEEELNLMSVLNLFSDSTASTFQYNIDGWDIYYQTFKVDDQLSHRRRENIEIIIIPRNIKFEEIDTEDVLDVQMIKTFDSLKFQEQQLLKCSSILGDSFTRIMLEYVMQSQNSRKLAEAIQKLFEIQVFSCARGIYTDGNIQLNHHLQDPNKDNEIRCDCVGFPTDSDCEDLPKYAMCGYLRYRQPKFRQTLYKLLTDNQATLYHIRAIWYLESETRRCIACGMGYFTQLNGQSYDDGMKNRSIELIPSLETIGHNIRRSGIDMGNIWPSVAYLDSENEYRRSRLSEENVSTRSASFNISKKSRYIGNSTSEIIGVSSLKPKEGKTMLVDSVLKARKFNDNNLVNCQCSLILITMYTQMLDHCQEATMHEKLMHAILEYASLCITHHNITVAFTLLERATHLLDHKLQYEYTEPLWQVPITRGRIMLLHGKLHIERDNLVQAEKCLINALKCYNLKFPNNAVAVRTKTIFMEIQQQIIFKYLSKQNIGSQNDDRCTLADQTAEVLCSLVTVYRRTGRYNKCYLASVWGLNEALKSNSNFYVMCIAYMNMIRNDMLHSRPEIIEKIETMALMMCYRKHTRLEVHELQVALRLYSAIFSRKFLCENVIRSLTIGFIVIQLNSPEYGGNFNWLKLPLLLKALIYSNHTHQARNLLIVAKVLLDNMDKIFAVMYYLLCIDFRTYTTYLATPFADCLIYANIELQESPKLISIEIRYHVSLWKWYLRKQEWQNAKIVQSYVFDILKWSYSKDPILFITGLNVAEGLLLLTVKRINTCDISGVQYLKTAYKKLSNKLIKTVVKLPCCLPRFYHLKAYYKMIFNKRNEAYDLLNLAQDEANKRDHIYEMNWIEHTKRVWSSEEICEDEWQKATAEDRITEDEEIGNNYPFFSFPLPDK